ncbi:2408_t:CDS:10 [Entrophospora sp. SA101]|nr:2408_t:CDS:10 [Entrophospora sp. SA101]
MATTHNIYQETDNDTIQPINNGYFLKDLITTSTSINGKLALPPEHVDMIPEYGDDIKELSFLVEYQTPYRIHISISDVEGNRWRVPESVVSLDDNASNHNNNSESNCTIDGNNKDTEFDYKFSYQVNPFGFQVSRRDDDDKFDNNNLFNTINERFIFKDQYIEISTQLPVNSNIYGIGETTGSLKRQKGKKMTLWARDAPCPEDENLYGSHPFYIELRNGKAHGVFLLNSNGMDICYENEKLTYKVIGGILDFYILLGPSPTEVIQQYSELIGYPYLIPYWSLGYHQCRWGYDTVAKVEDMVNQHKEAEMPMDCAWIDIDYMDVYKPFTYSPSRFPPEKFSKFVKSLHKNHQKLVVIVDPGIKVEKGFRPYDEGIEKNLFIKRADGKDFVGKVWPGTTVFPDWFHPDVQQYWTKMMKQWLEQVPIDGLWIDMNEIASFIDGDLSHESNEDRRDDIIMIPSADQTVDDMANTVMNDEDEEHLQVTNAIKKIALSAIAVQEPEPHSVNNPPYDINNCGKKSPLFTRTSPMDAFHHSGITEYNAHNLFGHMEAMVTYKSLCEIYPKRRPFVLSRSTFPGSGKYAAHWLGDNWSEWESMAHSIAGVISFQFFAIPLVGADVGGFNGQEVYRWEDDVKQICKTWLEIRYKMLPYWYTSFYCAATRGTPVIRPLWFLEPNGEDALEIDKQFLVGNGLLLVTPVTEPNCTKVKGYFPAGIWYEFMTGLKLVVESEQEPGKGKWMEVDAPLEKIPVHVYGGSIIPLNCRSSLTSFETRASGIHLLIALDAKGKAKGELYLDDGETLLELLGDQYTFVTFTVENQCLSIEGISFNYKGRGSFIDEIEIFGVLLQQDSNNNGNTVEVKVKTRNGEKKFCSNNKNDNTEWQNENQKLIIRGLGISLCDAKNENTDGIHKKRKRSSSEIAGNDPVENNSAVKTKDQVPIKTFYEYVEQFARDFNQDDLEFLTVKPRDLRYYEFPKLGRHYSEVWEEEDQAALLSQKTNKIDDQYSNGMSGSSKIEITECEEFLGPVTERLVSLFMDYKESMQPIDQQENFQHFSQTNGHNNNGHCGINNVLTEIGEKNPIKEVITRSIVIDNERVLRELKAVDLTDKEDLKWDERDDDEISIELHHLQKRLLELERRNAYRKSVIKERSEKDKNKTVKKAKTSSKKTACTDEEIKKHIERRKELKKLIGEKWGDTETFKVPFESIFNEEDMNNYVYKVDGSVETPIDKNNV